ncbi:unnamed protein product [Clonostachys rosea]|uniref:BZIP domain-containing protein n=1 Tax=Bionectria ochroleuca TaxID=29856 RepID=A0ABY6U288_BIOOC|nr:unnamed protein product [Clonostachys rosea]
MDPGPSSDEIQISKTTTITCQESTKKKDDFVFEPAPDKNFLPSETPEAKSAVSQRQKMPARKRRIRSHNALLDKLARKKTKRERIEWRRSVLLQKFSKELRSTKAELKACQEEKQAILQASTHAQTYTRELERSLNRERYLHSTTRSDLFAAREEASAVSQRHKRAIDDRNMMKWEVNDRQTMLDEAVEELNKSKESAATARQGQLKAISELNRVMRLSQGSDQSTDTQLVQKMVELRNSIRTWSLTHFTEIENGTRLCRLDMKTLNENKLVSHMREDFFEKSLQDPLLRPTVVRSFLWAILHTEVFRQYLWVVEAYSKSVRDINRFISSNIVKKSCQDSNELSHKFNVWRANGSAMLSRAQNPGRKRGRRNRISSKFASTAIQLWKPLLASGDHRDAEEELGEIIDQALALDEELCQQVADFSVQYMKDSSGTTGAHFNPQTMTTEIGSKNATEEDRLSAVLAPALVKRGNSAGNDFDKMTILLPMEVFCQQASSGANPGAESGSKSEYSISSSD